jgi:exonuclease III
MWVFCARIYPIATPAMAALARTALIHKDQRFSVHAPLTIDDDTTS